MIEKSEMELFTKTSTTLVYIASAEFAKELMKDKYHLGAMLYIHVGRDKGTTCAYEDNDSRKVIHLTLEAHEHILNHAEKDR